MKKKKTIMMILVFMVLVSSNFFGSSLQNAMAKEPASNKQVPYYKSIVIESGDSLWSIAEEYTEGTDISINEYIRQLIQMNGLKSETIHAGQYLTIMYLEDPQLSY